MDLQGDAGTTEPSRCRPPLITLTFEAVWPEVERRLRALLYRRGLDPASTDDVVQEVALRALAHHVTYASAADLLRWAAPVACNLHVDLLRHRARVLDDPQAADRPASDDVVREVTHRIELQRAFRGIAALRPADREALIDAVAEEPTVPRSRQEAVRLAVRRHRARSRLAVVLEQLAGWLAAAGPGAAAALRLARAARAVRAVPVRRARRTALATALVPAAALPLLGALGVLRGSAGPVSLRPAAPARAVAARPATPLGRDTRESRPVAAARVRPHTTRTAVPPATAPAGPARTPVVAAGSEHLVSVEAGRQERPPGNHLVCATGLPHLREICI
jgi:DNA-directed RNA polymerase specialized sigma24 family protein